MNSVSMGAPHSARTRSGRRSIRGASTGAGYTSTMPSHTSAPQHCSNSAAATSLTSAQRAPSTWRS